MKKPLFILITIPSTTTAVSVVTKVTLNIDQANAVTGTFEKFSVINGIESSLGAPQPLNVPGTAEAAIITALQPIVAWHFAAL